MFKLIAMAMHFSPFNQGPIDPTLTEMLRQELDPVREDDNNIVNIETASLNTPEEQKDETRRAA